jgi:hypothetical protein
MRALLVVISILALSSTGCGDDPYSCPILRATYVGSLTGELQGAHFEAELTITINPNVPSDNESDCSGEWKEDKEEGGYQGRLSTCAISCEDGSVDHTKLNLVAGPPMDKWTHWWDPAIGDFIGAFDRENGSGTWAINPDYADAKELGLTGSGTWSVAR